MNKRSSFTLFYSRNELNENVLSEKYSFKPIKSNNIFLSSKNYFTKYYKPSGSCMKLFLFQRLPFFKWITEYDYRANLFSDFISGITIGIIQIPQGMAYSLMVIILFLMDV